MTRLQEERGKAQAGSVEEKQYNKLLLKAKADKAAADQGYKDASKYLADTVEKAKTLKEQHETEETRVKNMGYEKACHLLDTLTLTLTLTKFC